jgi:hypothetical protein
MSFFHTLNKRLADLSAKQDAAQLAESKQADHVAQSPLTQALNEGQAKRLPGLPITKKDVEKKFGGSAVKMAKAAKEAGFSDARIRQAMDDLYQGKNPNDIDEAGYSAKAGRAGKDLGKPGKNFSKIAKSAGEKYGSKAAGERVAGAVLNKLRHPANEGTCPGCNCSPCECVEEGNAFTGKLKATPKGEKFKLGDKEFKDTSEIEEGFEEMDAWLASREKEKGTGKFDRKERTLPGGMKATTYTRKHEDDEADKDGDEVKSDAPKKKGRPKGKDKGPERVTKGAWKHKGKRKEKADEALDSDGVMMTRPTNCSSESIEHGEQAEYNDEAGMAKDSLHTIVRSAKELEHALRSNENLPEWVQEKIGQIKGMMSSVTDYIISTHERDVEQATGEEGISVVPEVAPPGAKAERMVKGIKKSLSKDGHLSDKDKAIAYATTWKARKAGKVEEAGKPDFLDLDKDGDKKEPMKKAAKDKKEEKVDETTVAGSVATASPSGKSSKGGMQFGKGVYEGINSQVESMITESISVQSKMEECGDGEMAPTLTIQADGEEAAKLMMLLKLAGLESQIPVACPTCGASPCGCDEIVDENSPDWPTNTEKLDAEPNLRTYSGGLNGPKSTGQSTTPVLASQLRRQTSMEESAELERNLFKTWKNYKG